MDTYTKIRGGRTGLELGIGCFYALPAAHPINIRAHRYRSMKFVGALCSTWQGTASGDRAPPPWLCVVLM